MRPEPKQLPSQPPRATQHNVTRLAIGQSLSTRNGQHYVIERYVAQGAAARVYAAREVTTDHLVAVRVLRDTSAHAIDRFQLEAIAYSTLASRHVPHLYTTGRSLEGVTYMVLDLLQGATLAQWLERGVLAIPAVVELGVQLMHGLEHVHSHALVHCDVKPSNVFVEAEDGGLLVKLIDFGICHHLHGSDVAPSRERATTVRGTPAYMSPEQISGREVDLGSDLYSAAAVLYRAITGRHPFFGRTPAEVMVSALRDPIVPPTVLRLSCPMELERIVLKALCRDARFRHASARELADDLGWIAQRYAMPTGRDAWNVSGSIPPPPRQSDRTRRITGSLEASLRDSSDEL